MDTAQFSVPKEEIGSKSFLHISSHCSVILMCHMCLNESETMWIKFVLKTLSLLPYDKEHVEKLWGELEWTRKSCLMKSYRGQMRLFNFWRQTSLICEFLFSLYFLLIPTCTGSVQWFLDSLAFPNFVPVKAGDLHRSHNGDTGSMTGVEYPP